MVDRRRETPWATIEEREFEDVVIERTTPHGSAVTGVRVIPREEWEASERMREEATAALQRIADAQRSEVIANRP